MPLSKKRDKERKRLIRLESKEIQPKQETLRRLRELMKPNPWLEKQDVQLNIPVYNPDGHYQVGDTVLVMRGRRLVETVIPEVDADGNAIPEFT